jgi:hypothetical protein
LNRRRFLKYAGVTAAVTGASALALEYSLTFPGVSRTMRGITTRSVTETSLGTSTASTSTTPTQKEVNTTRTTTSENARSLLNRNGDFCDGSDYWHPWHDVSELGYPSGLPETKWGYFIEPCQYGKVWINNPDPSRWDHAGLAQWSDDFPPNSIWELAREELILEADVMITEPDVLQPNGESSWDRAAIAFQWRRIDGLNYVVDDKSHAYLYSEYDVYRHNANFFHSKGTNVYEYHADQLPFQQFRHYSIDVNDFCKNGYESMGGWGKLSDESLMSAWYLVVETQGGAISSAWRNVQLRLK